MVRIGRSRLGGLSATSKVRSTDTPPLQCSYIRRAIDATTQQIPIAK